MSTLRPDSKTLLFLYLYQHSAIKSRQILYFFNSLVSGEKLFYYRGCGWKAKRMVWSEEDRVWIEKMDELFTNLFGPDYCEYEYTEMTKHCVVVPGQFPLTDYNHEEWERNCEQSGSKPATEPQHQSSKILGVAPAPETTSPQQDDGSTGRDMSKKTAGLTTQQHGNNTAPVAPVPAADATTQQQGSSKHTVKAMATSTLQNSDNTCPSDQVKPDDVAWHSKEILENLSVLTRGERASLKLPEVAFISKQDIQLVQSPNEVSNPLLVNLRPAESAVTHAIQLFKELSGTRIVGTINVDRPDDGDEDEKATVTMGRLGTFTKESVGLYQTMCRLASEAVSFREEERWLANNSSSVSDLNKVRDVLCNSRPNEEIIRQGTYIMDANDFSTLACERYVNGFTIDTVCLKFLEDSKPTNLVYLTSYSQSWAKQGPRYFSQMVMPFFGHCAVQDATYILSPFHFDSPQHWGLLCFDVASRTVHFDDGLKIDQPRDLLVIVKNMLTGFQLLSNNACFQEENWNKPKLDLPLPCLNMPHQTKTGEGSASCGVGVIFLVKDIIKSRNCLPSFQWTFKNMASLRKELMALIVQWKK